MTITTLQHTPLPLIVDCLTAAFADYFVQLPAEVAYWEQRFHGARVDYGRSYGVFDGEQLVAFIINGIDDWGGERTAFNTGTGVLPAYRGRGYVDQLYAAARPDLRAAGVTYCALEVISQNIRAIRVYERIGFAIRRRLRCFSGTIAPMNHDVQPRPLTVEEVLHRENPHHHYYSWDHHASAVRRNPHYVAYEVLEDGEQPLGFFIIQPQNGYVPCLELSGANGSWEKLLAGVREVSPFVKLNNLDAERTDLIDALLAAGLNNTIDQFEMWMDIQD